MKNKKVVFEVRACALLLGGLLWLRWVASYSDICEGRQKDIGII